MNVQIPFQSSVDAEQTVVTSVPLITYNNVNMTLVCDIPHADLSGVFSWDPFAIQETALASLLTTAFTNPLYTPTHAMMPYFLKEYRYASSAANGASLDAYMSAFVNQHLKSVSLPPIQVSFASLHPTATAIAAALCDASGSMYRDAISQQTTGFQVGDSLSFLLSVPFAFTTIQIPIAQSVGNVTIRSMSNTVTVPVPPVPTCIVVFKLRFV
jgi:hypothetical protein